MSLQTPHPSYTTMLATWTKLRDFYTGADAVKAKGEMYLPPTEGMRLDGMKIEEVGWYAYQAYKHRARVPEYVKEAVEVLTGLLHQKSAIIELPPQLEYLREKASSHGEPLSALHRRINVEQLTTGRLGLLVDLPRNPDQSKPQPYITMYLAESVRNWDDSELTEEGQGTLNMVALDESGYKRETGQFDWQIQEATRVLVLGTLADNELPGENGAVYRQHLYIDNADFVESDLKAPVLFGKALKEIPFTFVNSKDLLSEPDVPPLKGLMEICVGIYQGEADYRQNLYMQAQETLVVRGGTRNSSGAPGEHEAIRTGAGSRIDVDAQGDAKYIGVSANGLSEQRLALEADRKSAETKAGQLVQGGGSQVESGAALSTRFNAQTATLNQLAVTAAAGLEKALQHIAKWIGADETKIKVKPNTEFIDFNLDGQNFVQIMTARQMGLPISIESLHAAMADRGLTAYDFRTEMDKIQKENVEFADLLPQAAAPGAAPGQPSTAPTTPPAKDPKPVTK